MAQTKDQFSFLEINAPPRLSLPIVCVITDRFDLLNE